MFFLSRRSTRCLLTAATLLLSSTSLLAADLSSLPNQVRASLDNARIPSDAMSLAIIPLEGQGVAQYVNADQEVNPASTMKLVTTYAALELMARLSNGAHHCTAPARSRMAYSRATLFTVAAAIRK